MKTPRFSASRLNKKDINLTDLVVLTYLFERPMFGALLLGQAEEEKGGAAFFSSSQGLKSLRKLCALNLVKGFPEPAPDGPLLGAYYSIRGRGRELLLKALAAEDWLGSDPELAELWTNLTTKLGLHNFDKIARRAGPKTKLLWRKIGFSYPKNGANLFRGPVTFSEI